MGNTWSILRYFNTLPPQAQDTFALPLPGGEYLSSKLQVSSLLQGTGYNMDNLEHLKFYKEPIEDLILFNKLATKSLT